MQQQQLEARQAITSANLNLEENAQRKSILNAMLGTRVFRGSALSRALRGNTPGTGGEENAPAPSRAQVNNATPPVIFGQQLSLLDQRQSGNTASGNTTAGGVGGSGVANAGTAGGYGGGSNARRAAP